MWQSVLKPFNQEKHERFYRDLSYYRVSGKRLYVDRPYREDRHGHLLLKYKVDLETIVERPKKAKKQVSIKPPWNAGSKGRHHIYL